MLDKLGTAMMNAVKFGIFWMFQLFCKFLELALSTWPECPELCFGNVKSACCCGVHLMMVHAKSGFIGDHLKEYIGGAR